MCWRDEEHSMNPVTEIGCAFRCKCKQLCPKIVKYIVVDGSILSIKYYYHNKHYNY